MKKIFLISFLLSCFFSFSQSSEKKIAIIPEPVSIQTRTGFMTLPQNIVVAAKSGEEMKWVTTELINRLRASTGNKISVSSGASNATITLTLNKTKNNELGNEGYHLSVTQKNITIQANQPAGLFYGIQTLLQLLPPQIESATPVQGVKWQLPAVEITDYPRFEWRGLMLDVTRHFFTKQDVKHFIDDMVRYKYNILHMHLTDDEGWRIEIKSLPRLTEVGAWNVKKVGYFGTFSTPTPDEPRDNGGFYTQNDIRELVQYAKERFVNILPEIDVPGHSLAAVVSYPEISCTPEANTYRVRSGEEIMD